MIRTAAWLCWMLGSVAALAWASGIAVEHGSWGRFWAALALSIGVAGWLGGYARARIVGLLGCVGVLVSTGLRGADQPLPLIAWDSFDWWPVVAAVGWVAPATYLRKRNFLEWFGECLGLAVIAGAYLLYWKNGAEQILGVVELGFLILLVPSIGGGLGRIIRLRGRDRNRARSSIPAVSAVAVSASNPGDTKKMGGR